MPLAMDGGGGGRSLDCRSFWKAGAYEAPTAPTREFQGRSPHLASSNSALLSRRRSLLMVLFRGRRCPGDGGLRPRARAPQVPPHQRHLPQVGFRRLVMWCLPMVQFKYCCYPVRARRGNRFPLVCTNKKTNKKWVLYGTVTAALLTVFDNCCGRTKNSWLSNCDILN